MKSSNTYFSHRFFVIFDKSIFDYIWYKIMKINISKLPRQVYQSDITWSEVYTLTCYLFQIHNLFKIIVMQKWELYQYYYACLSAIRACSDTLVLQTCFFILYWGSPQQIYFWIFCLWHQSTNYHRNETVCKILL